MKTSITFFICLLCVAHVIKGQSTSPEQEAKHVDSLQQLEFMIGEWQGEGWIMMNRERKSFSQSESITPKVSNSILFVEGLGLSKDTITLESRVVHNAFGIISINPQSGKATMISFATSGGRNETELKLIDDKVIQWEFITETGGTARFTSDFSEIDRWKEIGEYSYAPGKWYTFLNMDLVKK